MKRRDFLRNTASGLVLPTIAGGFGFKTLGMTNLAAALHNSGDTDNVLILVYLSGGNDGLNTLVPLDQLSALNSVRPHVVMPENKLLNLNGTNSAFHPSFSGMKELFDEERLSIIQNVGYPNPDFSHFRSTDIWMSGSDSDEVVTSGWTGRYLEYEYNGYPENYPNPDMPDPLAIEIGWSSSMLFQGASNNMGMVINDPEYFYELLDETLPEAPDTKAGERLEYVRLIAKQSQQYGEVVKNAAEQVTSQGDYPEGNRLAEQLKICARLIKGGLKTKLYLVEYGGFDTHDNQVDWNDHTTGNHANLLSQVSGAIKAFVDDCEGLGIGDRVMGMTFSEFGRRVVSNASYGTDHGTTAPLFVFGNKAKGNLIGSNPIIPNNAQYWYNLEMEYDFRQVYASMFHQWLCVPEEDVNQLLSNGFEQLPLVQGSACSLVNTGQDQLDVIQPLNLAPNPATDKVLVQFISDGSPTQITLYDHMGKKISQPVNRVFPSGKNQTTIKIGNLRAGTYFVQLRQQQMTTSKALIKVN